MARRKSMNRGGKKLKSGLEIYCYDKLKEAKLKFEYEPESFPVTIGRCVLHLLAIHYQ